MGNKVTNTISKITNRVLVLILLVPIALIWLILPAESLFLTSKTVQISSATPSATSDHDFTFTLPSAGNIGSIVFEYCTNSPIIILSCTAPAGLDLTGATLDGQTLNTGFSKDVGSTTANRFVITRPVAAGIIGVSTYDLGSVINPSTPNETTFVRITTHASLDGSGPLVDEGSLAFSTGLSNFNVGVYVPPFLVFCVGQTVATNCSSSTSPTADFGELSSTTTRSSTTQFAAATNDPNGYDVYVGGQTMTSGNKVIDAISALSGSSTGTSQFGFNLRSNSSPSVGSDVSGVGSGSAVSGYSTSNSYKFVDGDLIARALISTDFNRYTASYIVNVPDDQAPGVYATSLSYTAVAAF